MKWSWSTLFLISSSIGRIWMSLAISNLQIKLIEPTKLNSTTPTNQRKLWLWKKGIFKPFQKLKFPTMTFQSVFVAVFIHIPNSVQWSNNLVVTFSSFMTFFVDGRLPLPAVKTFLKSLQKTLQLPKLMVTGLFPITMAHLTRKAFTNVRPPIPWGL